MRARLVGVWFKFSHQVFDLLSLPGFLFQDDAGRRLPTSSALLSLPLAVQGGFLLSLNPKVRMRSDVLEGRASRTEDACASNRHDGSGRGENDSYPRSLVSQL